METHKILEFIRNLFILEAKSRILLLILSGGASTFIISILLSTTYLGIPALALIPFSFLMFAAAALIEKHEYKPASFYAMLAGIVTFPIGGFLAVWGGFHAFRYHPLYHIKKLVKELNARPELVTWIQKRLDRGYMEEYLRHVLYIHGYKKEVVDAAFKKIVSG